MFRSTKVQMTLVLTAGIVAGYAVASGKLNPFQKAEAAPPTPAAASRQGDCPACRGEGADRAQFLVRADEKPGKKPNIVFIMGDDVGWFNIGAYHRGMMSGKTPNLDRLASQGMLFTDYYAEASCTAGRANFITGEIPLRTGLTTVGQAGADVGIPAQACTLATALKAQGYATGQFGKNHLGDRKRRSDRDAALGQDRQAEGRRRRPPAAVPGHDQHPEHAPDRGETQVRH